MTDREAKKIAVLIESHWPRPEFTDVDIAVMAESMRRMDVTVDEAVDAVQQLVCAGERFQPRAPQLAPVIRSQRADRRRHFRQIEPPPDNVVSVDQYKKLIADLRSGKGIA